MGIETPYIGGFFHITLEFEEPQWGLKPTPDLSTKTITTIRRTPMGIETSSSRNLGLIFTIRRTPMGIETLDIFDSNAVPLGIRRTPMGIET